MVRRAVIDFHTHPWLPDHLAPATVEFIRSISQGLREHGERLTDPGYAAGVLRDQGISNAVVLPEHCPRSSGNVRTELVLEFCAASGGFFLPFASVDPNSDPDPAGMMRRYVADGVVGLKLYPSYQHYYPNDRRVYPVYEICRDAGIPVLFHIGSSVIPNTRMKYCDPIHLHDIAVDFPELAVVMAHGGRGWWYDACAFLAAHQPNFFIDVTGLVPARLVELFPDLERISDKVVFGSDWPAMPKSPRANAEVIASLGLSDQAVQRILFDNAAALLRLDGHEPAGHRRHVDGGH
jgi:predicted TIM-barrel fold metal-dependent hydrolase